MAQRKFKWLANHTEKRWVASMYLNTGKRPDIAYFIREVSQYLANSRKAALECRQAGRALPEWYY